MLRLDPEHPPVWRDSVTLQFGAGAVALVHDPAPWQQRLVATLQGGIPDGALEGCGQSLGARPGESTRFVAAIAEAFAPQPASPVRVRVDAGPGLAARDAEAFAGALAAAGVVVVEERAEVVALLAHDLVHPRRAAPLMREDRAHLPVVFTGSTARVGPYVVPGRTPCLSCLEAHRRDADPHWPIVAAQLVDRELPAQEPALVLEAGIAAARLVTAGPPAASSTSVTLRRGSLRRRRAVHVAHPACLCRSLAGNATADAAMPPTPPTTTARAYARPA
jgi:bacteriocin biosynthesis cyclodehydratase domain-containing protein